MSSNLGPQTNGGSSSSSRGKTDGSTNGTVNNTTATNANSWSTLVPKRNLMLGGRGGLLKKEFKPNLNAKRMTDTHVQTSKDMTNSQKRAVPRAGKAARGAKVARGGNAGTSALVQGVGIFSEGVAANSGLRRFRSDTSAYANESRNNCEVVTVNAQAFENGNDDDVYNKYFDEIEEDNDLNEQSDDGLQMIKLESYVKKSLHLEHPMLTIGESATNDDVKKKSALANAVDNKMDDKHLRYDRIQFPANTIEELLHATGERLFIMQIPDLLSANIEDAAANAKDKVEANAIDAGSVPKPIEHPFTNINEGQIGKIVRYKSGKTKLILSEAHLNLRLGVGPGHLQELMSIEMEPKTGEKFKVINIGPIEGRLTATPDWNYIYAESEKCKSNNKSKIT